MPRLGIQLLAMLASLGLAPAVAADGPSRMRDAQDGALDLSAFLDTAYGFVPVISPITEPAVGYGAVGALVFIDRSPAVDGQGFVRPNIAVVGGLATENGTDGAFAGHLGTWQAGRLKTEIAVVDADANLQFFGLGGRVPPGGSGLDYTVSATGGIAGASYRIGSHPLWLGLRFTAANTQVRLRDTGFEQAGVSRDDLDVRLSGLTPSLTLDTRDNFFTPLRGGYLALEAPTYRESLGGERDFELLNLTAMYFHPLGSSLYLGARVTARSSSAGTPFYLRPYVSLRGVQALQFQGEQTADLEVELRWPFRPRWSVVGFAGAGVARTNLGERAQDRSVAAGGAGLRYLLARSYGLHMGLDVAAGPDEPVVYVVFGSRWLRP